MLFRKLTVLLVVFLVGPSVAVGRPKPGDQLALMPSAGPRTLSEALAAVDELLESAKEADKRGQVNEVGRLLTEAQQGLELLQSAYPRNPQVKVLAAEMATLQGNHNDARKLYKEVLGVEPSNFRASLGIGRFYVGTRLYRQAGLYLKKAVDVSPPGKRAEALRWMAISYAGQGNRQGAIDTAKEAIDADPTSFESLRLLVSLQQEAMLFEEAVESAEALAATARSAREAEPSDAWVLQRLIVAYEMQVEVLKAYHNSLHTRDAHNRFTDELLPGKDAEAADVLSRIARVSEKLAALRWELSCHDSLMLMERAVEYQPDNTGYLLDLAGLLLATHQTDRAIDTLESLLEISDPTDANPDEVRRNREAAEELLGRLTAPQPADGEDAPPPG